MSAATASVVVAAEPVVAKKKAAPRKKKILALATTVLSGGVTKPTATKAKARARKGAKSSTATPLTVAEALAKIPKTALRLFLLKANIRRQEHRAQEHGLVPDKQRELLGTYLRRLVRPALLYMDSGHRKTLSESDVSMAYRTLDADSAGHRVYGLYEKTSHR
jgi:histone H3/H4